MGMQRVVSCSFLFGVLAACTPGIETGPGETQPDAGSATSTVTDFDRAMMQIATTYKTFPKIDKVAYASTLGAFTINVYVKGDSRAYRAIHPEDTTTMSPAMAVGTVIVREVLAADGTISKLTLMAKGPSGYDPTLGDWWFGEAGPDMTPIQLGRIADCHGCHIPRAAQDYLFGVPKVDQPGR